MSTLQARLPVRTAPETKTHMLVADGTITIAATGVLTASDARLVAMELAEAFDLCGGVVVLDLTGCRADRAAVRTAITEARAQVPGSQCHLQVVTADGAGRVS
ncbi:hypothetical protein [Amycolatopsis jiangsuensis]|uniref:STAS domain-containing protein n=1 Tax=Amycolatopsis jiangsuensis TaxID=1181879 RepID=A0A840INX2_9PSEU|nr:hypothetical protein [Amycolatopsis jiangsuensis]MBB4682902.1 hypothetical protein [Amycolatopsis jiangsuensis]